MKLKTLAPWKKSYDHSRQHIKKQGHYFANKGLSSQCYGFFSSHVWMGDWDHWTMVLEKTLESPLDCKEIKPVNPKENQSWIFIGRTDVEAETPNTFATWYEEPTHLKRPWCWERLKVGGEGDDRGWEGDDRGWDGWMASPTWRTWVWINSRSWWWTGRLGLQRVRHNWVTEVNWTDYIKNSFQID